MCQRIYMYGMGLRISLKCVKFVHFNLKCTHFTGLPLIAFSLQFPRIGVEISCTFQSVICAFQVDARISQISLALSLSNFFRSKDQ